MLAQELPSTLPPAVKDLVHALNREGFMTTDSGDGSNYKAGMACAMPFKHVVCIVRPEDAIPATKLQAWIDANPDHFTGWRGGVVIESSWDSSRADRALAVIREGDGWDVTP